MNKTKSSLHFKNVKLYIFKATELSHTNMTEFMLQLVLPKAREIVQHEQKTLCNVILSKLWIY